MGSFPRKQVSAALSFAIVVLLTWQIIASLSELRNTVFPEASLIHIALCLAGFFFPILTAWQAFRFLGGVIVALYAAVMVFFAGTVTASPVLIWFLIEYAALCYLLFRIDQDFENQIGGIAVDREKYQNEKNDLEVTHKAKGEGISILFEKYSTYYNLRKLAEELATSFSVSDLSQMIVSHSVNLIAKGDVALLSMFDTETQKLTALAFKEPGKKSDARSMKHHHHADLFDLWVVKNQRRLIVNDAQQDFRFDIKETARLAGLRSVIIAPLLHERRVIGTLRVNSASPENFSNDDLRLLDTIAVLASSALSNAMLYEKTEDLAIHDSLTNVFVRRYFFERMKEEHRRALMTHRPLSFLMCDLDHFKECNDRYGHAVGDLMLTRFAEILKKTAENAMVGRYGGEEFCVLMPEVSREQALVVANRIREAVEKSPFEIRREKIAMTVSIGVSNLPVDSLDMESLVQKADQALYLAKHRGRNQVCYSES